MVSITTANSSEWGQTKSGRLLASIRRSMEITDTTMRPRWRNEEILSVSYHQGSGIANAGEDEKLRSYALNIPYVYARYFRAQATGKKMIVRISRDAGEGQYRGQGPSDAETLDTVGICLGRVAYEGGFKREMDALIQEVLPRGVSVLGVGYHEEAISLATSREVGKDAQTVGPDVAMGDLEAHKGQAHAEIAEGLAAQAEDAMVQAQVGSEGVAALLERKASHDEAAYKEDIDRRPTEQVRAIRRRIYLQKLRVGEDVGWDPTVYDTRDAKFWWRRHLWTVADVKKSDLFTAAFKKVVKGDGNRYASQMSGRGQTPSAESMGSEERQAGAETHLDDDERLVEWFEVYFARPNMRSGGYRKIVCAEFPEDFVDASDENPNMDDEGRPSIPGFYPFFDFAPEMSSLTIPSRTLGVPPIAAGMTQFEKLCEYNRLRRESALKHSLRLYQLHPNLKDATKILKALNEGTDGYAFVAPAEMRTIDGKMEDAVKLLQFTGNTQEIDRQAEREKVDCLEMLGLPAAIYHGMGMAETASQDKMGMAGGQAVGGALLTYFEERMADVFGAIRGLMRANYDDEDYVEMVGAESAKIMKAWLVSSDRGDKISVTFGMRAAQEQAVEKKQLMEAITLEKGEVEPVSGLPMYDHHPLFVELHRRLDVGPPKPNDGLIGKLQEMLVMALTENQQMKAALGVGDPAGGGGKPKPTNKPSGGPNPSEGSGPSDENISAGAFRGTVEPAVT